MWFRGKGAWPKISHALCAQIFKLAPPLLEALDPPLGPLNIRPTMVAAEAMGTYLPLLYSPGKALTVIAQDGGLVDHELRHFPQGGQ